LDLVVSIRQGDVISHYQMCEAEKRNLQQGMNFRPNGRRSVILMSLRKGAPYADRVEEGGRVLIYEGHDAPRSSSVPNPKTVDQPEYTPHGGLTQNGRFARAAQLNRDRGDQAELVHVYEKLKPNIWTFNGVFRLVNAWIEPSDGRKVFKFELELVDDPDADLRDVPQDLEHNRLIPSSVKLQVWKRDRGQCVKCGSTDNLHFDHVLPFSKGGSSLVEENVQLLCARHNLAKSDRIE
jgi:HNH endonuclease